MTLNFVSIFDQKYLIQGVTALEKIMSSVPNCNVHVVALDDMTSRILSMYFGDTIRIINLKHCAELNNQFQKFLEDRKYSESIFSLKAHALSYVMSEVSPNDWAVYVDADVYIRVWPAIIKEAEVQQISFFISKHRFSKKNRELRKYGDFNAGFVGFKKNNNGMSALNWWQESCDHKVDLSLTYDNYADQGYLNLLPKKFAGFLVLDSGKINQGMWNAPPNTLSELLAITKWEIFHFHGFRVTKDYILTDLNRYGYNLVNFLYFAWIYVPYIAHTRDTLKKLEKFGAILDVDQFPQRSKAKVTRLRMTFGLLKS
jgi:hypothetical protein